MKRSCSLANGETGHKSCQQVTHSQNPLFDQYCSVPRTLFWHLTLVLEGYCQTREIYWKSLGKVFFLVGFVHYDVYSESQLLSPQTPSVTAFRWLKKFVPPFSHSSANPLPFSPGQLSRPQYFFSLLAYLQVASIFCQFLQAGFEVLIMGLVTGNPGFPPHSQGRAPVPSEKPSLV